MVTVNSNDQWASPRVNRKFFHFVRHAEGEANVSERRIGRDTPLTGRGQLQANLLARCCKSLAIDAILTSPVQRAAETALIVGSVCGVEPVVCDLLRERKRPSELDGAVKRSARAMRVNRTVRENFHIPGWRFSNEENFDDLKERAHAALRHLDAHGGKAILAITHGIIMRILVACILHGEALTGKECENFIRGLRMEKTGLVTISVDFNVHDEGIASRFQLWTWNDYGHLTQDARGGSR